MKLLRLIYLLSLSAICSVSMAQIQSPSPAADRRAVVPGRAGLGTHRQPRASATAYRLIGVAHYTPAATAFEQADSGIYTYSGTRYQDRNGNYEYDTYNQLSYNVSSLSYDNMNINTQTFDAHNNMLTNVAQTWDPGTMAYINTTQTVNTYDANNNMLTQLSQVWDDANTVWFNNQYLTFTYDAHNNQTSTIFQSWTNSTWTNSYKVSYTYSTANLLTQAITYNWDMANSVWVNSNMDTYYYDTHNNNTQIMSQTWNTGSSSWVNFSDKLYVYTSTNQLDTLVYQSWGGTAWVDFNRQTYAYDSHGNIGSNGTDMWNGSSWDYVQRIDYSYGATTGDRLSQVSSVWNGAAWVYSNKDTFAYDASHDQLSDIFQTWDSTSGRWLNGLRFRNTYDTHGNITVTIDDTWNVGGYWQVSNTDSTDAMTHYYYESYSPNSTSDQHLTNASVTLYPSPAYSLLNIDIAWEVEQKAIITICDVSGRIWRQWQTPAGKAYQANIPVSDLDQGIYYMSIKWPSAQVTRSFGVVR